jgi:hypothetical protein
VIQRSAVVAGTAAAMHRLEIATARRSSRAAGRHRIDQRGGGKHQGGRADGHRLHVERGQQGVETGGVAAGVHHPPAMAAWRAMRSTAPSIGAQATTRPRACRT